VNRPDRRDRSVIKAIKEKPDLRNIAVVVFSSSAAEQDIQSAVSLHTNAYIRKPATAAAIDQLFEGLETFWRLDARLLDGTQRSY